MLRITLAYCLISTHKNVFQKRIIELIYDFVIFEAGIKKLPRAHQYFGVKESQKYVKRSEGVLSGTPKEVEKVSPWCIWQNGYWRTTLKLV